MFISAQARSRYIPAKKCWWDGKIGIWPVGYWSVAQKTSVNRPAGTPERKNKTINAEMYLNLLLENIVSAIVSNWPIGEWTDDNIRIQQDGAKAHMEKSAVEVNFIEAMETFAEQGILPLQRRSS